MPKVNLDHGPARKQKGVKRRYLCNDETCMFARLGTRRTSLESGYDGNRMANAMRSERTYGMACTVPVRPGEGKTRSAPMWGRKRAICAGALSRLSGTYRGSSHTHQARILLSSGGEGRAKANE